MNMIQASYYARQSFQNGQLLIQRLELLEASELLEKLFRREKNTDSAFYYQDIAKAMTDSLYGPQKFKELQLLMLQEQQRQQEIQRDQERYKNKTKMIGLWSAIGVFFIIAFLLYRNNRHKQKANALLQSQKEKIQHTLSELKATQSQLIQSEKMASLGELTAGIAHEYKIH
jgi:C4-dicarboxylate-specific signal transduction histidine kinase